MQELGLNLCYNVCTYIVGYYCLWAPLLQHYVDLETSRDSRIIVMQWTRKIEKEGKKRKKKDKS